MRKHVFTKIVCLLIAAALCLPLLPALTAKAASPFETKVSQLRSKFPQDKYWNHVVYEDWQRGDVLLQNGNDYFGDSVTGTPCATHNGQPGYGQCDCNVFDHAMQCMGFANRVFFYLFENYASRQSVRTDVQNVSIGDWVAFNNEQHYAVVLTRNGDYLTIVEGNRDGNCRINWDRTVHISTISYFKRAPNWSEIVSPHTHSYTTYVRYGDAHPHYKYYKCSCGDVKETSEVAYTDVTVPGKSATCTESGLTAGAKCSICGKTTKAQKTIPALGHDFRQTGVREATCTTPSADVFTCSRCGEVEYKYSGTEGWSEWSAEKPAGKDVVESKTQYRYADKKTTTSAQSTLDGWTRTGQSYSAWGGWSGWTLGSDSSTDTKEVQTGPMYRYGCFRCANCGAQDPYSGACDACGCKTMNWDERWSAMSYASSGYAMNGKPYTTNLGDGRRWYFTMGNLNDTAIGTTDPDSGAVVIKAGYRYRTRSIVYQFEQWGDFSAWQDTEIAASNTKKVETRTLYRYYMPTSSHVDADYDGFCDRCGVEMLLSSADDHVVFFNANGHGKAPAAQSVAHGESAAKPSNPKAAGWAFGGWYTDAKCTDAYSFEEPVMKDLTLYAKWTKKDGGSDKPGGNDFRFNDVKSEKAFYFEAVYWAYNAKPQVTNGLDKSHFGPTVGCTRGQVVTFLWRTAGCPEPVNKKTAFRDVKQTAFYAEAVAWAVEQGITKGISSTSFAPDATCTRGQIVTFLWRFRESPAPARTRTAFTDVSSGAFYAKAVAWAVENGVTKGMTDTSFAPDATCTRGQIVTFLYRALNGK